MRPTNSPYSMDLSYRTDRLCYTSRDARLEPPARLETQVKVPLPRTPSSNHIRTPPRAFAHSVGEEATRFTAHRCCAFPAFSRVPIVVDLSFSHFFTVARSLAHKLKPLLYSPRASPYTVGVIVPVLSCIPRGVGKPSPLCNCFTKPSS